jgi:hypothetical protein
VVVRVQPDRGLLARNRAAPRPLVRGQPHPGLRLQAPGWAEQLVEFQLVEHVELVLTDPALGPVDLDDRTLEHVFDYMRGGVWVARCHRFRAERRFI